jgi:N-acetylglucosamine-6-phosphate deacetylase
MMSFGGTCRIPGKSGFFSAVVEDKVLTQLNSVSQPPDGDGEFWLSPGLFDIQVNGMLGYNLSDEDLTVERVAEINEALENRGVTRWCPTITTQDPAIVGRNLGILREVIEKKVAPNIHCIHMEGHYISSEEGYRGVHMERFIRDPDPEEFDRWQEKSGGHIGLFSLAPERKGAMEFIRKLRSDGVRVGLVHHHADHNTVLEAHAAGASLSTHLVNGCAKMIHRQHNILWSQLSIDDMWASFIADGYHIPHYTLRAVIKAQGINRSILTSDLAHLSGMPEGEYFKYDRTVVVKDGGLWVKSEGTDLLSGAVKTLEQDCEYLASHSGFSIEQALLMASLNPARYFGIEDQMELFPGRKPPMILFSWKNNKLSVKNILE